MLPQVRHRHCHASWYRKSEQVHRMSTGRGDQPNDEHECEHCGKAECHLKKPCDPAAVRVRVANPKMEANDCREHEVSGRAHYGTDNCHRYPLAHWINHKVDNQAGREEKDSKHKAPSLKPSDESRCNLATLMTHVE